jgi:hypothetical protein
MQKICTEWLVFFLFPRKFVTCGVFFKCETLRNIMGKKITLEPFEPMHVTIKINKFPELPFLQGTSFQFPRICNHY